MNLHRVTWLICLTFYFIIKSSEINVTLNVSLMFTLVTNITKWSITQLHGPVKTKSRHILSSSRPHLFHLFLPSLLLCLPHSSLCFQRSEDWFPHRTWNILMPWCYGVRFRHLRRDRGHVEPQHFIQTPFPWCHSRRLWPPLQPASWPTPPSALHG